MSHRAFDDVLNECIAWLRIGVSVDECVSRYPEYEDQLRPLLEVANAVSGSVKPVIPRNAYLKSRAAMFKTIDRVYTQKQTSRQVTAPALLQKLAGLFSVRSFAVLASLLVILVFSGLGLASQTALPGDLLYPMKRAFEGVQTALIFDGDKRAAWQDEINQKRQQEMLALAQRNQASGVIYQGEVKEIRTLYLVVGDYDIYISSQTILQGELHLAAWVEVNATIESDGKLWAAMIRVLDDVPDATTRTPMLPVASEAVMPTFMAIATNTPVVSLPATPGQQTTPIQISTPAATQALLPTNTATLLPTSQPTPVATLVRVMSADIQPQITLPVSDPKIKITPTPTSSLKQDENLTCLSVSPQQLVMTGQAGSVLQGTLMVNNNCSAINAQIFAVEYSGSNYRPATLINESFDDDAWLKNGWETASSGLGISWYLDDAYQMRLLEYGETTGNETWLLSPAVTLKHGFLRFDATISPECRAPSDVCDLEAWLLTGLPGEAGAVMHLLGNADDLFTQNAFTNQISAGFMVDASITDQPVRIAIRYIRKADAAPVFVEVDNLSLIELEAPDVSWLAWQSLGQTLPVFTVKPYFEQAIPYEINLTDLNAGTYFGVLRLVVLDRLPDMVQPYIDIPIFITVQ